MRIFRSVLACTLSAGLAFGPAAAWAQDKKDPQLEEARVHAAKAKVHYDLGEYQQAAEEYTAVYRIKAIPQLLFNIAQSWRQASQYDKAKQFYRAYLREAGEVKNRAAVEKAIKEIDELLAKEKKTRDGDPKGIAKQPIPPPPPALPEQKAVEAPQVAAQKAEPAKAAVAKVEEPPKVAVSKPVEPSPKPVEKAVQEKSKPTEKAAVVAVATQPAYKPAPAAAVTARPVSQTAVEESSPIYKKWWFWTAVGVVAVGGGLAAASAGGGSTAPASHFGTAKVF